MNTVLPAIALGVAYRTRTKPELSKGRTWYFAASVRNNACISLSLSGILGREIVVLREVLGDVVELPFVVRPRSGILAVPGSQGGAAASCWPSSRRDRSPRLPTISKYCVSRFDGHLALALSNV